MEQLRRELQALSVWMGSPDADAKENPHKQLSLHTRTRTLSATLAHLLLRVLPAALSHSLQLFPPRSGNSGRSHRFPCFCRKNETFSLSSCEDTKSVLCSVEGRALHWASGLCYETQEEKHGKGERSPEIAFIEFI